MAIYKLGQGAELGATEKPNFNLEVRGGLETVTSGFKVQCPNHPATQAIEIKDFYRQSFIFYLSVNVLAKFHGKPLILHTLLIHTKRKDSLKKNCVI